MECVSSMHISQSIYLVSFTAANTCSDLYLCGCVTMECAHKQQISPQCQTDLFWGIIWHWWVSEKREQARSAFYSCQHMLWSLFVWLCDHGMCAQTANQPTMSNWLVQGYNMTLMSLRKMGTSQECLLQLPIIQRKGLTEMYAMQLYTGMPSYHYAWNTSWGWL